MAGAGMDLGRNGLGLSIVEGSFAMLSGTFTTGVFLTGYALLLGADTAMLGAVAAVVAVAQLAQLGTPLLLARGACAKPVTVWGASLSRYLWLPIALLPFMPLATETRLWAFLALLTVSSALGQAAGTSWSDWMADMVPGAVRGRYFGLRNAVAAGVGLTLTAAGTWWLDAAGTDPEARRLAFAAIFAAVIAGSLVCHWLLHRQPAPPPRARREGRSLAALAAPLREARFRAFAALFWGWTFVIGVTVPFLTAYLLQDLGYGYGLLGAHAAAFTALSIGSQPVWGRVIDRLGAQRALAIALVPIAVHPLYWLALKPERAWPLALDALSAGLFWPGVTLACLALMMEAAPAQERAGWMAVFSAGNGVATGVAALVGAALLGWLGGLGPLPFGLAALQVLLVGSCLARVAVTIAIWRAAPLAAPQLVIETRVAEAAPRPTINVETRVAEAAPQPSEELGTGSAGAGSL